MAGKFTNVTFFDTQDSIVKMNEDLVKNPFYLFNDKKGTKVKYYNINTEKSTLDPSSKLQYSDLGPNSPIKYNVIEDLYLYQFNRAELNLDNGEFGMESDPITGESYILPNTIVPIDGDYFEVPHIKDSTWLFRVTDVQKDTLDNGANVYKISWQLNRTSNEDIVGNVVEEFKYINTVEGTNLKSVVKTSKYELATKMENLSILLGKYFKDLFYSPNVQTFIYRWYNDYRMYDPFAIEFIIRNNILFNSEDFIYVGHMTPLPATFSIDYAKSFYRAFEEKDIELLCRSNYKSQADYIDHKTGIFQTQFEPYWSLNYKILLEPNGPLNPRGVIDILDKDFINNILEKKFENIPSYKRIIVKYFNNIDLCEEDLVHLECIELESNKDTFYLLLLIIFCLDFYIKKLLS